MDITAITVNFKTPDLIANCRASFEQHYPDVPHILVDNGGCKESLSVMRDIKDHSDRVTLIENPRNIGHGPALDQGLMMTKATARYAFLLDSDTEVQRGGFLEKMLEKFDDPLVFAVGWLRWVNERGLAIKDRDVERVEDPSKHWLPYIHPYACLMDASKYRTLIPFARTGAPAFPVMQSAKRQGYTVTDFPVSDYIWHKGAGTRALFNGQIRPDTKAQPGQWRKLPI